MPLIDALPTWLSFPLGFALLILGAEWLVRGASRLAGSFGISPLIIGLTVVAFGTSAPELAVSVDAGLNGNGALALGNVVGSNIANILLILGLSALMAPLVVKSQLVRIDVPLMILVAAALWIACLDGFITRLDGGLLATGLLAYILLLLYLSKKGKAAVDVPDDADDPTQRAPRARLLNLLLIAIGLGLLVLGARWLVDGATRVARALEVSDLVIGLTVVAIGTSLPELTTSIMASIRGQRDIAVGNIVGSNIFNVVCVIGISAFVTPDDFPVPAAALRFDLPVMMAVSIATFPIFFTGGRINRWEGLLLLAYFVAYTLYLLLDATGHNLLGPYSAVMLAFFIPLTALGLIGGLVVSASHRLKARARAREQR
jgi:cation:H+ antiporter